MPPRHAIAAAYAGAGIYALTINPVFSSLMLLAINYRQNPLPLRLRPGRKALGKVFSFSAYQFSFQLINYFSRNLDKLLMGRYMRRISAGYQRVHPENRLCGLDPFQPISHRCGGKSADDAGQQ